MSMFVFKTVVLVLVLASQRLVATAESCPFPSTALSPPAKCEVIWKENEDKPLKTENFTDCKFEKQHIIATLPNGVDWEIWENPNNTDSDGVEIPPYYYLGTATFYGGTAFNGKPSGAYRAKWKDSGDFISRAGLQFEKFDTATGKMKKGCTYTKYGKITAEYRFTKTAYDGFTNIAGTYSYIGVYGWARNPLLEYYIIDDWFGRNDIPMNPAAEPVPPITVCNDVYGNLCKLGEYEMDGGTYILYSKTRGPAFSVNGPSECFTQIYAVRKTTRQCGTIQIDRHFAEWAKSPFCLVLNEMYEAKILVESGGGEGSIDFSHLTVTKEKECTEGDLFTLGEFPVDSYQCPADSELPPLPSNQLKYVATCHCAVNSPATKGSGAEKLWSKKTWMGMAVLWAVFFLLPL